MFNLLNKLKKVFLNYLGLFLLTIIPLTLTAHDLPISEPEVYELYATPDQLILNSEGIFVVSENFGLIRISRLFQLDTTNYLVYGYIENYNLGLYDPSFVCPIHGLFCNVCYGCAPQNKDCPNHCTCSSKKRK